MRKTVLITLLISLATLLVAARLLEPRLEQKYAFSDQQIREGVARALGREQPTIAPEQLARVLKNTGRRIPTN